MALSGQGTGESDLRRDWLARRVVPGELFSADAHSLKLVDGSTFLAPPGMILPAYAPGTALRVEYVMIGRRAILRSVPQPL